ncbi:MAG: hypothetical protein JRI36_09010 [Deltaproteobacteria bacterium]|nr:hypothetical protein [Deltaproteobacteria bacterium]
MGISIKADTSEIASERARVHALFTCILRPFVEKHGGTIEIDPATYQPTISIPRNARGACFEELGELLAPGTPLNCLIPFLM